MRAFTTAVLGAALMFGCGDDDGGGGDDGKKSDAGPDATAPRIDGGNNNGLDAASGNDASRDGGAASSALASLVSKSNSSVTGSALFEKVGGVVTLTVSISNASPGQHGLHIHEKGDCSSADATSAGAHWNPSMHNHGAGSEDAGASHLGDLGNITIAADGKGSLTIGKRAWTLGDGATTDVVGHAIVFHANQDDLVTQNGDAGPGNSGPRLACGEIKRN